MNQVAAIDSFKTTYLDWKFNSIDASFISSIKSHGVMAPVLCIELNDTRYIIDGYKRYQAAKIAGNAMLPFTLISTPDKLTDLLMILQRDDLMTSAMQKIRFLTMFKAPLSVHYLADFKLPYYSHIKKDFDRIGQLTNEAQLFLHQKQFSLKEIVNLLHFSTDLFYHFLSHDTYFCFSKRSFDETLALSTALMKRLSLPLDGFLSYINYDNFIHNDLTVQQRLKKLHAILSDVSMPILIETQKKIDDAITAIGLPAAISYDRTLENPGIGITSRIASKSDLSDFLNSLTDPSIKTKLENVMDLI